jgi:predicted porin
MNKKLMAVAVAGAIGAPGLAFAQAANVSIYGHFDGGTRISKYSSSTVAAPAGVNFGGPAASAMTKQQLHFNAPRWGLRGSEDLGGGLTAFFQLESGMNPDGRNVTSDGVIGTFGGRDSYVGLRGGWGSFAMGGFTAAYSAVAGVWNAVPTGGHAQQIMGNTDTTGTAPNPNCNAQVAGATGVAGTAASPAATLAAFCTATQEGNATSFHRRTANYIEYTTPNMSGFTGKIGTALAETKETAQQTAIVAAVNPGAAKYDPRHWSYSLVWSGGPFSAAIGHETHRGFRATNVAGSIRDSKDKGTTIGGKWNFGAGELGVGWERLTYGNAVSTVGGENGFAQTNWVINGNYKITAAGTISAGYSKTPGRKNCGAGLTDAAGTCGSPTGASIFNLAYDHALSKRTGLYAMYGRINNNGNAVAGATYNYIAAPTSNGGGGTVGGLVGGTDVTSYILGLKHNF